MENEKKAMVVVQLYVDVIAEILSRLCVKDLIRFKSVCKAWLQLISSKDFIKLHLQRSSFRVNPIKKHSFNIECIRLRNSYPGWSTFCGSSCDGLVCLFDKEKAVIHIWNPALRTSACIPMKKRPPPCIKCSWFGLYNGEYKLVLGTRELEMHVVRPYIDSCYNWKSTQKLRDGHCCFYEIGTLFNGNVHWPVRKRQVSASNLNYKSETYWTILSYDLHLEKVGEIVSPKVMCSSAKRVSLGEVDGCLCALVYRTKESEESELWAMKEYGVKESWTKLMVIHVESAISSNVIRLKEVAGDRAKMKLTSYMKLVYVESLVSPKLCTERLLRSHKKPCRIIEEGV